MKAKTALKQSWNSVKFLSCVLPLVWGLYAWTRHWSALGVGGFMTLFLIGDLINIAFIKRKARRDPNYLNRAD